MRIEWASGTDKGPVRPGNEDFVRVDPKLDLVVLCDGMGGHLAGEVASKLGVESFFSAVEKGAGEGPCPEAPDAPEAMHALIHATWSANKAIFVHADSHEEYRGMGCTIVALQIQDGVASFVTVGDSRLYLLRSGTLHLVSQDHTRLRMLQQMGIRLDPAEARQIRGMLVRALGTQESVEVDYGHGPAGSGDRWMLCSDGLTDELDDTEIKAILETATDPQTAVDRCLERAVEKGGRDNVTVAIADVIEGDETPGNLTVPRPETCSPFAPGDPVDPEDPKGFFSRLSRRLRGEAGEPPHGTAPPPQD